MLLTVIVPVYNVKPYLSRCLDSIIHQACKTLEIILVNDGSTDGSGQICDEYAQKDKRIVIIHKPNGGLSSARNAGLDIARGDLIGFIDSDDWIAPDTFGPILDHYAKTGADIILFGYYEATDTIIKKMPENGFMDNNHVLTNIESVNFLIKNENIKDYVWNKIFTKSVFKDHRFLPGRYFEDTHIMYSLFLSANRVAILGNHYNYFYSQRPDSIVSKKTYKNLRDRLDALYTRYDNLKHNKAVDQEALFLPVLSAFVILFGSYPVKSRHLLKQFHYFAGENSTKIKDYSLQLSHKLMLFFPFPVFILLYNRITKLIYKLL
jgi:glycosyltransferase involved in cell wall biosynthesis